MVKGGEAGLKRYRVELGKQALAELEALAAHLTEQAGLSTAKRWSSRLRKIAASLRDMPYRGSAVPAWGGRRKLVMAPYLIVYQVAEPDLVIVQSFVDGRRNLDLLFGDEVED